MHTGYGDTSSPVVPPTIAGDQAEMAGGGAALDALCLEDVLKVQRLGQKDPLLDALHELLFLGQ